MPGRRAWLWLLWAAGSAALPRAASAAWPEDPFLVPRGDAIASARTVAVAPLVVSDDFVVDAVDRGQVMELVQRALRDAGLTLVGPAETGPILEEARKARGGYLDASTGKVDRDRYEAVMRDAAQALRQRFGADRVLSVVLRPVEARMVAGVARWDQVEEEAAVPIVPSHLRVWTGKIWALSISVWLRGADAKLLYGDAGGLRLIEHLWPGGKTVPVPDADLLADDELNAHAVQLALGPLLATRKAPAVPGPSAGGAGSGAGTSAPSAP
jgi:hypothetical protein